MLDCYWEFFCFGVDYLFIGLDYILFLLVLIVGSCWLCEIVFVVTIFTFVYLVMFIFVVFDFVYVFLWFVELVIVFLIVIVFGFYLWWIWWCWEGAIEFEMFGYGFFGFDVVGCVWLVVVFCFGLIYGFGFVDVFGID